MIKFDINVRLHKLVAASSSDSKDYTPADGQSFVVVNAGGSSCNSSDSNICVVWDPDGAEQEIILTTYRDTKELNIGQIFTGDGTRVLRVVITNDLTEEAYLGGYVQAEFL